MTLTKKELSRLTSLTMSFGMWRTGSYGRERQFVCPVHHEAKRANGMRYDDVIRTHRFSVFQPHSRLSNDSLLKRDVQAALAQHLADADLNGEPCNELDKAVRG